MTTARLLRILGTTLLEMILCSVVRGQVYQINCQGPRTNHFGSCVAINEAGGQVFILTAAHVLEGCPHDNIRVGINGQWVRATFLASARPQADLALLSIASTPGVKFAPLADADVPAGSRVMRMSYIRNQLVQRWENKLNIVTQAGHLIVSRESIPGESGGAILREDGKLLGIIYATSQQSCFSGRCVPAHTLCVPLDKIREFAKKWNAPAPQPPASIKDEKRLDEIEAKIDALADAIGKLAERQPERGPQGERGPPGPPGTVGDVPPITVEFLDAAGNVAFSQKVKPGGTLRIPPVLLQSLNPDGSIRDQIGKPLGQPLKIQFSPVKVQGAK